MKENANSKNGMTRREALIHISELTAGLTASIFLAQLWGRATDTKETGLLLSSFAALPGITDPHSFARQVANIGELSFQADFFPPTLQELSVWLTYFPTHYSSDYHLYTFSASSVITKTYGNSLKTPLTQIDIHTQLQKLPDAIGTNSISRMAVSAKYEPHVINPQKQLPPIPPSDLATFALGRACVMVREKKYAFTMTEANATFTGHPVQYIRQTTDRFSFYKDIDQHSRIDRIDYEKQIGLVTDLGKWVIGEDSLLINQKKLPMPRGADIYEKLQEIYR